MALPKVEFDFEHHTEEITEFGWPWHGLWTQDVTIEKDVQNQDGSTSTIEVQALKTNSGKYVEFVAPEPTPEITTGTVRFYGSVKANLSPIAKTLSSNAAETAEGMQLAKHAIYSGKDSVLYNQNMYNKWVFIDGRNKPWLVEIGGGIVHLTEFGVFTDDYYTPKEFDILISNYNPQWIKVDDITKRGDRALLTNWTLTATELGKDGLIEALTRKQYMGVYELIITGNPELGVEGEPGYEESTLACEMIELKTGAQLVPVVNQSLPPRQETESFDVYYYRAKHYKAISGVYNSTTGTWSDVVYDWVNGTGDSLFGGGNVFGAYGPGEVTMQQAIDGGLFGNASALTGSYLTHNWTYTIPSGPGTSHTFTDQMNPSKYKIAIELKEPPETKTVVVKSVQNGWSVTNRYIGCFYDKSDVVQHVTFDIISEYSSNSTPDYTVLAGVGPYLYGINNTNIGLGNFGVGYYKTGDLYLSENVGMTEVTSTLLINGAVVDSCVATSKSGYKITNTINQETNSLITTSEPINETKMDGSSTTGPLFAFPIQYSNTLYGLAFPGPGPSAGQYTWRGIHGKWGDLASKETVAGFKVQASENPITGEVVRSSLPVCFV